MNQTYILKIAYLGTNYSGWQSQDNAKTVQGELNNALKIILKKDVETLGSGRTDAGVHAMMQFVHFKYDEILPNNLVFKLNAILPFDIKIYDIYISEKQDFHARFDAISRKYRYFIHFEKPIFNKNQVWFYKSKLDFDKLNHLANVFLDITDFSSFCKANADNFTNNCIIYESKWVQNENGIYYEVKANRFLRGMVRALVGTMTQICAKNQTKDDLLKIIEAKNRSKAGPSAPPDGLFLWEIEYPYEFFKIEN